MSEVFNQRIDEPQLEPKHKPRRNPYIPLGIAIGSLGLNVGMRLARHQAEAEEARIRKEKRAAVYAPKLAALLDYTELPGYGQTVPSEYKEGLKNTAVAIGMRKKGSDDKWFEMCSGNKVEISGESYVMTAGHCFTDEVPMLDINYFNTSKSAMINAAADITSLSEYEYAVLNPNLPPDERVEQPLGVVAKVSLSMGASDVALLTVDQNQLFDAMPSLAWGENAPLPLPGSEFAMYSFPAVAGLEAAESTGVYLGTEYVNYGQRPIAVVGILSESAEDGHTDSCSPGGSGSGGITTNGNLPLIMNYATLFDLAPGQVIYEGLTLKQIKSLQLDISLEAFARLCHFAMPEQVEITNLQNPLNAEVVLDVLDATDTTD